MATFEPTACETSVSHLLDLSKGYAGEVKDFRKNCPAGAECAAEGAAATASFTALTNAHAGLIFACTPGSPESCDGIDNDKDGSIDEDFPAKGNVCTVGIGACQATGVGFCSADGSATACSATAGAPSAERCDGQDNNCDGAIDEPFNTGQECTAGLGACQRIGINVCSADGFGSACTAHAAPPGTELCSDGVDNDCDGAVDEGFDFGQQCTVGIGACQRSGIKVCTADRLGTACSAQAAAPGTEVCGDRVDNNCDGVVDEGC